MFLTDPFLLSIVRTRTVHRAEMSHRINTAPVAPQQPRNVYLADARIDGMTTYYAITSWGMLIGPVTVDPRFFTDLEVVEHLEDVLDLVDPQRPKLTLLPACADSAAEAPPRSPACPSARLAGSRLGLV